jgi:hypothetical protein
MVLARPNTLQLRPDTTGVLAKSHSNSQPYERLERSKLLACGQGRVEDSFFFLLKGFRR